MGFIDSDTHVRENERTWSYLDPAERRFGPDLVDGKWRVGDTVTLGGPYDPRRSPEEYTTLFPQGSVGLEDPGARLRRMDELGVDVHVLFSTFWIAADVTDAHQEAALARSWNRWMAEATAGSGGRLRWALQVPFRLPERAVEEMHFGREHGAVAVHLRGARHGYGVGDPIYEPLYRAGQDLDLVMAVHVGGDGLIMQAQPNLVFLNNLAPVPGAMCSVLASDLPARFPSLRWAFLEAGASWLPFALQQSLRVSTEVTAGVVNGLRQVRGFQEWHPRARQVLEESELYVACEIDDDLPYLSAFCGHTNLVHGTDYGHLDVGSDPYGLHIIARRPDLGDDVLRAIVDGNGRRLWGIDPSFRPAPTNGLDVAIPQLQAVPDWFGGR